MNALAVVRAAIPGADERLVEAILWERTPFPCGSVTARQLYVAAARYRRASAKGLRLCDLCDRFEDAGGLCVQCWRVFAYRRGKTDERDSRGDDGV